MIGNGDRVKIKSADPTTYLRFGDSPAPAGGTQGTVLGTALVSFGRGERRTKITILQVRVRWQDGTEGLYASSALVKVADRDAA
jgi:hypothetical protein